MGDLINSPNLAYTLQFETPVIRTLLKAGTFPKVLYYKLGPLKDHNITIVTLNDKFLIVSFKEGSKPIKNVGNHVLIV